MRGNNLVQDGNGWETISSDKHFADKHLEVATDVVRTPAQKEPRSWLIVHRKPAVVIAPLREDGKFLLVRQVRIPIRSIIWEMPAGQIDDTTAPNQDDLRRVALRELEEETRHTLGEGGELIPLGHYFSSPGFTDEHGYFFLARPVEPCRDKAMDGEELIIDCRAFSVAELRRMIAEGEIRDANTLSMCARLVARGFLSLEPRE